MRSKTDRKFVKKELVRFNLLLEAATKKTLIQLAEAHKRTPSAQVAWLVDVASRSNGKAA